MLWLAAQLFEMATDFDAIFGYFDVAVGLLFFLYPALVVLLKLVG